VEETLKRIKELVLVEDRVAFSKKARDEMAADHLTRDEVVSSIYNAKAVRPKRSKSSRRRSKKERVYIIEARNDSVTPSKSVFFTVYADGRQVPAGGATAGLGWRMVGPNKAIPSGGWSLKSPAADGGLTRRGDHVIHQSIAMI
jgi:hypothetical protein